jgi:hypothetical protein
VGGREHLRALDEEERFRLPIDSTAPPAACAKTPTLDTSSRPASIVDLAAG